MKKRFAQLFNIYIIMAFILTMLPVPSPIRAGTTDLFISEYIEGSSFNKAIEIYNGTGAAVDLATGVYSLELYSNGSASASQTMDLSGTVADGDVFVVAHAIADSAILAQADVTNSAVINFNGDDAIVLRKNGVVVDVFGQVGTDPGSEWTGGGQDDTLRRKIDICEGDTNPSDAFDASLEWDSYAQNTFGGLGSHVANCGTASVSEVLLTEIVVTPTGGEFVEIHNPTGASIDLSDYYLTDATFAGGGAYYYNIVTGSNAGGGGYSDFHARFPDGASIGAGEYQTIAIAGSAGFVIAYGSAPDYELFDDLSNDGEAIMREALPGSIANQGGLTNDGEVVILYYWDGTSDLVTDVDYAVWGDKAEAVDKTGVTIDGPDADSDTSAYLVDTGIASQDVVSVGAHTFGNSWQRKDLTEGTETSSGGNGVNGEDETSEDLSATWCESAPTPGSANACVSLLANWIINEIHADPVTNLTGDANGDGVRDSSADEFIEIVNNGDTTTDISGWTLSDAVGLRHTFPSNTVIPAGCSVVVFGGGIPTGIFGNSVVQTATTGFLGFNNGGDSVTLLDGAGKLVTYSYGAEGGNDQSLTRDPDITGLEPLVHHTTATGSGGTLFSPGTKIDGSQFAGCPMEMKIHDVQGSGTTSPVDGKLVIIEGVVVGDFQDGGLGVNGDLNGFFLQEEDADADTDPTTSEGIFVYDGSSPAVDVSVGDVVRVTGTVDEYFDLTELTNVDTVVISSSGSVASAATVILPVASVDDWEWYEGMLVHIPQTMYATDNYNQGRYGEIELSVGDRQYVPTNVVEPGAAAIAMQDLNSRSRIQLEDGRTTQNPIPPAYFGVGGTLRAGDTITELTGVLNYAFGVYEVHPTSVISFTRVNTRPDTPPAVGGSVKVASFNVLNYFSTIDNSGPICGPSSDMECRGADTPDEFTRQRTKIIDAIIKLDADVIGLMEIENHATDAAVQDLISGLNDLAGAETYAAIDTGPIGTDAIKQALVYRPGSVTPFGAYAILDTSVDPRFIDTLNRPVLAQTFEENATGEKFTVAVNHLKSKGSDCNTVSDPDTGDGQGNCNLTRTAAANALVTWLATDPTYSGDPDYLIIGDLNSYAMEDPIDAIKAAGYKDLLQTLDDPYSYVYFGEAGYLDHALANNSLAGQVSGVNIWHINADEPSSLDYNDYNQTILYQPDQYRASDHDPIIVGLELKPFTIYMPLVVNRYIAAPDLVVDSLVVTENAVQVVVKNQGNLQSYQDFWVDVYIDPDIIPTAVNQMWSELGEWGMVWGVTMPLAPGETILLTSGLDSYYAPDYSRISWPLAPGTPVFAQVDSWNETTTYGAVLEEHEIAGETYNNISGTLSISE